MAEKHFVFELDSGETVTEGLILNTKTNQTEMEREGLSVLNDFRKVSKPKEYRIRKYQ